MGALAMIGEEVSPFRNAEVIGDLGIHDSAFEAVRAAELAELQRRQAALGGESAHGDQRRGDRGRRRPGHWLHDARRRSRASAKAPAKIIVAVPVASRSAVRSVGEVADLVVCPAMPEPFFAVGAAYKDFRQLTDDQVTAILQQYAHRRTSAAPREWTNSNCGRRRSPGADPARALESEDPHRQPGADAEPDCGLTLEAAREGHLAEGREAGHIRELAEAVRVP